MPKVSAGLLVHRRTDTGDLEVLLVHPGGPLWQSRDDGVWSIPKGEVEKTDDPEATAEREFGEELGMPAPAGERIDLGQITQRSGKLVRAWAVAGDLDAAAARSNTFEMQWPRGSGRMQAFPEIDRAGWFAVADARRKLIEAQVPFLDRLARALEDGPEDQDQDQDL
jgi:predicted NUDIX family NTP pyrophosphohydrolase